jgi:uncharacterized RDD family membrane protein YckC
MAGRVMHRRLEPGAAEGSGVWFFPSDYAGFWRRLAVELVDLVVITIVLLVVSVAIVLLDPSEDLSDRTVLVVLSSWAVFVYGYFVLLKRSRLGTAGYRLVGVRIVDAAGRPPGLRAMTFRLLFGLFGPLNIVLDMLWIPSDRHRQTLRDKFAGTYVVKINAEPAGPARVVLRTYYIVGMAFVFRDVEPLSMGGGVRP